MERTRAHLRRRRVRLALLVAAASVTTGCGPSSAPADWTPPTTAAKPSSPATPSPAVPSPTTPPTIPPAHLVSVVHADVPPDAAPPHVCGGWMWSNRHVITAAHCVSDGNALRVRVGSGRLLAGGVVRDVAAVAVHPEWRGTVEPGRPTADVALLTLAEPVPGIDAGPRSSPSSPPVRPDERVTVPGWGADNPTGRRPLPEPAQARHHVVSTGCRRIVSTVAPDELCLNRTRPPGACYASGGGPVVHPSRGVVGIVSRSLTAECGAYVTAVDLRHYAAWIANVAAGSLPPSRPAPAAPENPDRWRYWL